MSPIDGLWSTAKSFIGRILDIDQFWWIWFSAGIAAIPFFLAGIGVISIVYAVWVELRPPDRDADLPLTIDCPPSTSPSVRARGESMIPGAVGLALLLFSLFLGLSIERHELTILVVGLPLVLGFAPAFVLFAFGYRAMPIAFGTFLGLAGVVLLGRLSGLTRAGDGLLFPLLVGAIVALLYLGSYIRARRRAQASDK
jgi:hypothetical protein